jgi:histidinol-phosphate aminotransferase
MSIRPKFTLLNKQLIRPSALDSKPRNKNLIWLDKNENIDPILQKVTKNVMDSISIESINTYPEAGPLYKKISKLYGTQEDGLILTPGSDGAIRMVFEAFVNENDCIFHTYPTFAMYPVYSKIFGANVTLFEYSNKNGQPFLDTNLLIEKIKSLKPKLVCLPNPDSPTGTIVENKVIIEILNACEISNSILLIDEAYYPFYNDSPIELTFNSRNIIIARTFAKAWGAAGMRIGYAIGHPDTILYLHKIRPMYELGTIPIEFMNKMLDYENEMLDSVKRIKLARSYFVDEMRNLGFKVINTEANFVHVNFGLKSTLIQEYLSDKVLYRDFIDHQSLQGFSRFSIGTLDIMEKIVNWIKTSINKN